MDSISEQVYLVKHWRHMLCNLSEPTLHIPSRVLWANLGPAMITRDPLSSTLSCWSTWAGSQADVQGGRGVLLMLQCKLLSPHQQCSQWVSILAPVQRATHRTPTHRTPEGHTQDTGGPHVRRRRTTCRTTEGLYDHPHSHAIYK